MGKASVTNITVSFSFIVVSKALAMARLSVVASPLAILPPPPSQFCPLAPYYYFPLLGWHPTALHQMAPYCPSLTGIPSARWFHSHLYPPRSSHSASVTPGHSIALPPWPPPMPWSTDVITGAAVAFQFDVGLLFRWFSYMRDQSILSPRAPFVAVEIFSFVLVGLGKGLALSTCMLIRIVSLCVRGIFS